MVSNCNQVVKHDGFSVHVEKSEHSQTNNLIKFNCKHLTRKIVPDNSIRFSAKKKTTATKEIDECKHKHRINKSAFFSFCTTYCTHSQIFLMENERGKLYCETIFTQVDMCLLYYENVSVDTCIILPIDSSPRHVDNMLDLSVRWRFKWITMTSSISIPIEYSVKISPSEILGRTYDWLRRI